MRTLRSLSFAVLLVVGCGGRSLLSTEEDSGDFGDGDFGDGDFGDGDGDLWPSGGRPGVGGGFVGAGGWFVGSGGVGVGGGFVGSGGVGVGGGFPGSGGAGVGGTPGFCNTDQDCPSPESCLVGFCGSNGACEYALRDQDGDGYADEACGGLDCNDLNPLAHPGRSENCTDGTDNNCNGVADCFDPACVGGPCGCTPSPGGENCQNGQDDDCDGAVDCHDADCVGTVVCGCTTEQCGNGVDDDCDGKMDCADSDCAMNPACVCQAQAESCTNGVDDDCDGRIDCSDSDCVFHPACLCLIPQAEKCGDKRDNDCNGLIDCGDPVCFSSPLCSSCTTEVCTGGVDEDCDGLIDCADPSCAFDVACPSQPELCNNDIDDDFDGQTDCDDLDCKNTPICIAKHNTCATARFIEPLASATYTGSTQGQASNYTGSCGGHAGEAVFVLVLSEPTSVRLDTVGTAFDSVMYVRRGSCGYGAEIGCDDDSGGVSWAAALNFPLLLPGTYFIFVDGFTVGSGGPNAGPYTLNVEVGPVPEDCADGFDNDGDFLTDCADPECAAFPACVNCNNGGPAVAEYGTSLCTDGIDNDCDGLTDCLDDDCSASTENITECCTGFDQNGNGIPDDFNCRCKDDSDCSGGQICYTSTLHACGLPCDRFYGEVCPSIAAGSNCNAATRQCEF